jgi:hypothetical protein
MIRGGEAIVRRAKGEMNDDEKGKRGEGPAFL